MLTYVNNLNSDFKLSIAILDPAMGSGEPATVNGFSLFIPSEQVLKLKRKMDRTSDVAASAMVHHDEPDEMFEEASNIARESTAYIAGSSLPSPRGHRLMGRRYGWKNEIRLRAERARRARARGEDPIYTPLRDGTHDLKFCENCKKPQMQMQKCSGCLWARYCSKKCQKQHWPCHKPVCLPDTSFQQLGFFGRSRPWEEHVMATSQNIIECTLECTDGSLAISHRTTSTFGTCLMTEYSGIHQR